MLKMLLLAAVLALLPAGARAETQPTPRQVAEAMRACLVVDAIDEDPSGSGSVMVMGHMLGGSRMQSLNWVGVILRSGVQPPTDDMPVYAHPRYNDIELALYRSAPGIREPDEIGASSFAQGAGFGCFMGTFP
jgi:hypothetical protein